MSKTVAAEESSLPALLQEIANSQEEILVTADGITIAKLVPVPQRPLRSLEWFRANTTILGDIMEPLDEWECEKDELGPEWAPWK